tara:strand:+ start:217 stop:828 length:612 start_codon:yes stop_codon:yes gene_type:complete
MATSDDINIPEMQIMAQPESLNITLNDLRRMVTDFQNTEDENVKRALTKQALDIEERIEEYGNELSDVDTKISRETTKQGNLEVEEKRQMDEAERKIKEAENKIKEAENKIKEAERNMSKARNRKTDLKQQREDTLNKIEETEHLEVYFYRNLEPLIDRDGLDDMIVPQPTTTGGKRKAKKTRKSRKSHKKSCKSRKSRKSRK